jgi:sigma-B regulation protein RsbU (phosphoserine phosphatase)
MFVPQRHTDQIQEHMARLSDMAPVYRTLRRVSPDLIYWQYTSLKSGLHTSYPGHGGYDEDYDPRKRQWYQRAKQAGHTIWTEPFIDASTGNTILSICRPVTDWQGQFVGVTAIDILIENIFNELTLPGRWEEDAQTMLVMPDPTGRRDRLQIIIQKSYVARGRPWRERIDLEYIEADESALVEMIDQARQGHSDVQTLVHEGREAFWANGPMVKNTLFTLIILPRATVVNAAELARRDVQAQMWSSFLITAGIVLVTLTLVTAVAIQQSRVITRPIRRLATVARRFGQGDYDARVHFERGDELQELAETLNALGPELQTQQQHQAQGVVAEETRQLLQPAQAKSTDAFDVAARVESCRKFGADFVDLLDKPDDDGQIGGLDLVVGDVAGDGMAAFAMSAGIRAICRERLTANQNLPALLDALNQHLLAHSDEARFCSLTIARLDENARRLEWVSAGQDGPLLVRAESGQVEQFDPTGPVVGAIGQADFDPPRAIDLQAGDVLAIGADGIANAQDTTGRRFGSERLRRRLRQLAERSADEILVTILDEVKRFSGPGDLGDDLALVILKVRQPAEG